jgi:SAM-dependent methyltransferase
VKDVIYKLSKPIAERVFGFEAYLAARWSSGAHRRLMMAQWGIPPTPEHFDHDIDLFFQWRSTRNPLWVERGVFGSLALKGGRVLDLACGDGFNACNFYSLRSREIIACDFDPHALRVARRKNSASNVTYVLADIRFEMPDGRFENVTWDAAIEHFTEDETASILTNIKRRLTTDGVLSGYTLVQRADHQKHLGQHERQFVSLEELRALLCGYFLHVKVFETIYPARHNLYFWASDGPLPLSD